MTFDLTWWMRLTKSPFDYDPNPPNVAELKIRMQRGLDYASNLVRDGRPLLTGSAPNIADFTLAPFF